MGLLDPLVMMILIIPAMKRSSNALEEHTMTLQGSTHGSHIDGECPTDNNQSVQPGVSQPEGSNLQASGHSEVAQILNSELTSSSVQNNKTQIKNKKFQSQIKNKKSQKPKKNP